MWRYWELLPIEKTTEPTPLRVGWSPLYEEPRLAQQLGLKYLWGKDDGQNPTASLEDCASAIAVAKAQEAGAKVIACSSTGSAAINPYLSEGKKTVALEIMEQLNWQVPDYIAASVGGGCTIAGLWKGLKDLYAIGFIDHLPRLISAQAAGVTGTAGVKKLCEAGVIGKDDTVVSVVTDNGLKDVASAIAACGEPVTIPGSMDRLLEAFAEKGIDPQ